MRHEAMRMEPLKFRRRSHLITPVASERVVRKALQVACDALILDLEDAISPDRKAFARSLLRDVLLHFDDPLAGRRELGVRVNGLGSPWWLDDLLALRGLVIHTVVVPKIHEAGHVAVFDHVLGQVETPSLSVSLQPMIESARGLENACAIAAASRRNVALIFGVGDYAGDLGVTWQSPLIAMARSRVVNAAASAGLCAVDQVHPAVSDPQGLGSSSANGRAMGFSGKWAIHPSQLGVIDAAFTPSEEEIAQARRVLDAYETSLARGSGVTLLDGALIDEAVLKTARRHLAMAGSPLPS